MELKESAHTIKVTIRGRPYPADEARFSISLEE